MSAAVALAVRDFNGGSLGTAMYDPYGENYPLAKSLALMGGVDCSVGDSVDFPGTTLITVIGAGGDWYQFSYTDGRSNVDATKQGTDYTAALNGMTWQQFKANSGINCRVTPDGKVHVS